MPSLVSSTVGTSTSREVVGVGERALVAVSGCVTAPIVVIISAVSAIASACSGGAGKPAAPSLVVKAIGGVCW